MKQHNVKSDKNISIVIPTYNEETNIEKLHKEVCKQMDATEYGYEFIFVDDGSQDASLDILKRLANLHENCYYIELSKNFGHQHALKCGMDTAEGDCIITMDCDLQHPPEVISQLLEKWEQGFDIVYTCREESHDLSFFKRKSSSLFYSLMNRLSDIDLENGAADFRLMNRKAADAFIKFEENELFIRGLVKWMGFRQASIRYVPNNRFSGESKYSVMKMISFAIKGITSFSTKPLKIAATLGLFFFFMSLTYIPYVIISYFNGHAVSGWTSLIVTVIFFGGLQLLMVGIIGLYLGKLVIQAKYRPLYFIKDTNYRVTKHKKQNTASEKSFLNV